ncbi:hypothetical protein GQ53DRAFT_753736 [Thozetella sp. PMI_491]|nr:hypothetical protein GQ53DRAFT_753736 [Thozetella sp. PMI_491]
MVLLDAYSRAASIYSHDGLLSVYSTVDVTDAFIEQVTAALVAVTVQRVRIQDWKTARDNERAASS